MIVKGVELFYEKVKFLVKLRKEKKLQLIEPNSPAAGAYSERSRESLHSAKVILDMGNLKDSVALTYYSMYYGLLALLFKTGVKRENHARAILLLKEVFF